MKELTQKLRNLLMKQYDRGFIDGFKYAFKHSETLYKIEERSRILKELKAQGSTGDNLELSWDSVLAIFDPAEEEKN